MGQQSYKGNGLASLNDLTDAFVSNVMNLSRFGDEMFLNYPKLKSLDHWFENENKENKNKDKYFVFYDEDMNETIKSEQEVLIMINEGILPDIFSTKSIIIPSSIKYFPKGFQTFLSHFMVVPLSKLLEMKLMESFKDVISIRDLIEEKNDLVYLYVLWDKYVELYKWKGIRFIQSELGFRNANTKIMTHFVSHKWKTIDHPDPSSRDLRLLQEFIKVKSKTIKIWNLFDHYFWIDYCCLKQKEIRGNYMNRIFRFMLPHLNVIQLISSTIIILPEDKNDYVDSAWCSLESYVLLYKLKSLRSLINNLYETLSDMVIGDHKCLDFKMSENMISNKRVTNGSDIKLILDLFEWINNLVISKELGRYNIEYDDIL